MEYLAGIAEIDTAGAWIAWRFSRDWQAEITGASEEAKRLIAAVSQARGDDEDLSERPRFLARVSGGLGGSILGAGQASYDVLGFLGEVLSSLGTLILHPGRFRMKALVHQMELVGISALPIIGLMTFLVGITIATVAAEQLALYGADRRCCGFHRAPFPGIPAFWWIPPCMAG